MTTGCAVEPSESQLAQSDTVIRPAKPNVWCPDCLYDRVAGEPVHIGTSYHGECEGLFGTEYECEFQDYTLSAQCTNGTCTVEPPQYVVDLGSTIVVPSPGTITITVTMNATTFVMPTFRALVPDGIQIDCYAGLDERPCTSGANPEPVLLVFWPTSGGVPLMGGGDFVVESTAPGDTSTNAWWSEGPGRVTSVRYGSIVVPLDITIKTPWTEAREAAVEVSPIAAEP